MAASNQKRIAKELDDCAKNPIPNTVIRLVSDADLFHWEIVMDGPEQSVYAVCSYCLAV
jgi:ubiquitin-protein ligase